MKTILLLFFTSPIMLPLFLGQGLELLLSPSTLTVNVIKIIKVTNYLVLPSPYKLLQYISLPTYDVQYKTVTEC